ncbi:MAG: DUF393 domain-containing protein [Acidimicrobiales bacterium]|nr:DUF393 domain-containing protein [Hyphomonadaceae bacterium]RZV41403.1 MAG: DUF393 domain-containing protein [Acidimicrobiales bacterium]
MCRYEIEFYNRRSGADKIDWVDVSRPDNTPPEITCELAMSRFHVCTPTGKLIDGGAAFAELWKQLPAFRWFGVAFSLPPLRWVLNIAYSIFLPLRPYLQRVFTRFSRPAKLP